MNAQQPSAPGRLRILFICIGNSCRSPMAESIALRDAADLFEISSAGLSPLGVVQKLTLQTLKGNGYPIDNLQSKPIRDHAWDAADLVINMSGYPRERAFRHAIGDLRKVEDWDVEDPYGSDPAVYQRIFEDIRSKIEALAARIRASQPS